MINLQVSLLVLCAGFVSLRSPLSRKVLSLCAFFSWICFCHSSAAHMTWGHPLTIVSFLHLFSIPSKPPIVQLVWAVLTLGLIFALAMTAFRDPGILPRYETPPSQNENAWRWSDRALSYRPRGAFYDSDTAVIVEGFDHTWVRFLSACVFSSSWSSSDLVVFVLVTNCPRLQTSKHAKL